MACGTMTHMETRPKCKLWLETPDGRFVLGEGTSALLRFIRETGSLSDAAKACDISYAHAWKKIRKAEKQLGLTLVDRMRGGTGGGCSSLSEEGASLLDRYDRLRARLDDVLALSSG